MQAHVQVRAQAPLQAPKLLDSHNPGHCEVRRLARAGSVAESAPLGLHEKAWLRGAEGRREGAFLPKEGINFDRKHKSEFHFSFKKLITSKACYDLPTWGEGRPAGCELGGRWGVG